MTLRNVGGSDILLHLKFSFYSLIFRYKPLTVSFLAPLPPLTDDRWRVPFSFSKSHQIQVVFRQLRRLCLQSRRYLPVWCRHEPVSHRYSQVFYWPAQAALPGCVQT